MDDNIILKRRGSTMANLIKKHDIFGNDLFKDLFDDDFLMSNFFHRKNMPPVNISETDKEFMVEMSAPGIKKDEIKITRQGTLLNISYEHKDEKEEKDKKKNYYKKEFQSVSFSRSIQLPDNVDLEKINSEYHDGILKISVPKLEKDKDKPVEIKVK
jgi:HSP20 family protein